MHVYDSVTKTMSIVMKGAEPIEIRQTEVSIVDMSLDMTAESDFFDEDLISRIAALLGIPMSKIRVVEAIGENDVDRRRRDTAPGETIIRIEIGENPKAVINESPRTVVSEDDDTVSSNSETG